MVKKVCISGYYGFSNFGDEAILDVLVGYLKSKDAQITIFSGNPKQTSARHRVNCIKSFNIFSVINAIKKSDVLFSGGGSLLQDKTSLKSLLYYLFIIFCALFFKKEVVIFAQGIGPIKNIFARQMTKQALKNCNIVTVRDDGSLFLVRGWGIPAQKVCDPIWNIQTPPNFQKNKIGVQLRKDKFLNIAFLESLAEGISKNFKDYDVEIFSYQDSFDLEICKQFKNILIQKIPFCNIKIHSNLNNDEIIEKTADLKYMIAMRFHACLLALKYGIKTIAINYDIKVKTLAQEFSIPCMELTNPSVEACFGALKQLSREEILEKTNQKQLDLSMFDRFVSRIE